MNPQQIEELNRQLQSSSPVAIIKAAYQQFEAPLCAFSGAEDVVLIDMLHKIQIKPKVFCLDTGRLHPETYQFIEQVRETYQIDLAMLYPDAEPLADLIYRKGLFSFYRDGHQECCGIRKIEPMKRHLKSHQARAWITGQRQDQSPTRSTLKPVEMDQNFSPSEEPLVKFNPLVYWSLGDVWDYIRENQVPYNALHDQGYLSIGCEPCSRASRPGEHERAGRWWWEEAAQRECGLHLKYPPEDVSK